METCEIQLMCPNTKDLRFEASSRKSSDGGTPWMGSLRNTSPRCVGSCRNGSSDCRAQRTHQHGIQQSTQRSTVQQHKTLHWTQQSPTALAQRSAQYTQVLNTNFSIDMRHRTAQHSTAQHSTQHSTAQNLTAQYSTAQYSTAQIPKPSGVMSQWRCVMRFL